MKKTNYFLVSLIICLTGCTGQTTEQPSIDISGLLAERDSFKEVSIRQQQELNDLNLFVGTVSDGLDSIAQQEHFIRNGNPEGGKLTREQLKKSLEELAQMLARHRERIAMLEDSLQIKGTGAENLHNIVTHLNEQLNAKEKIINQLRAEVNNKNVDIARLQTEVVMLSENVANLNRKTEVQQQALITQSDMMNECYVKVGTKKELKNAGITDGKKLNPNKLTSENFTRVDIRQFTELHLPSKKPKILTNMPQSSYTIAKNSDGTSTLTIKDPTQFWRASNYLVISLE